MDWLLPKNNVPHTRAKKPWAYFKTPTKTPENNFIWQEKNYGQTSKTLIKMPGTLIRKQQRPTSNRRH